MHGPPFCMPCPRTVRALVCLASSWPCTVRVLVRLVPAPSCPCCSSGPVPARSTRLLVWSGLCVICTLACLALSLYRPRPCSPCIIPVWSAFLLGLALTCMADFDGSPSCSTGPLHARSAILLALPCPLMVCALVCLALSLYLPRSCSLCLVSARSALLLASSCPCIGRPTARLVLSLYRPRSSLP